MRKKKVWTYWEAQVRNADGDTICRSVPFDDKSRAQSARDALCFLPALKETLHVVRVTRRRHPPLIKLAPWAKTDDGYAVVEPDGSADAGQRIAVIEVDGEEDSEDGCNYEALIYGAQNLLGREILWSSIFECSDLSQVQQWAEEKLRKLGYRVAR